MRCVIVSHTHWDREWYRTFQAFRARLVDTVDRVLELMDADPDYHFQLDGQSIVLEDYLEVRPDKRDALARACAEGRLAIGPWYVQPDSLLPSGEAHIRNLLEGRRVANTVGPCSTLAYTPDSFGHPAQFPQLFAGFGLGPFIYWRGNGSEIDELPSEYRWVAPDGSSVVACHLARGYFAAWGLAADRHEAARRLRSLAEELAAKSSGDTVLLMNGIDHMLPDANTAEVAQTLADETGWKVERGLLDAFASGLTQELPEFRGELLGGRVANLLPGVWSTRTNQKLRNRRCEALLENQAEPWAALGCALGAPDESASIRSAWRSLLPNQAHDSICGCSQDRVHSQMEARYDACEELAVETTKRVLERIAGLTTDRQLASTGPIDIAVFNPSPHTRSDVVRLPLEGYPAFSSRGIHPLLAANVGVQGFTLDGEPARLIVHDANVRPQLGPGQPVHDLEFVAREVPAFGWKRMRLEAAETEPDIEDHGRAIEADGLRVAVDDHGGVRISFGALSFSTLIGFEDLGDRGDSYDFDPVGPDAGTPTRASSVLRRRHPSGIQSLTLVYALQVPRALSDDRSARASDSVTLPIKLTLRVAPGVPRVDLRVRLDNTARDHRLRMLFATGRACERFDAATTFDHARRTTGRRDGRDWIHPPPDTIPIQGWVHANGLCVVAPGLPEAQVDADGVIGLTLVRSVGWLSRPDLTTRPGEAGPALPTPGAQCPGPFEARLALLFGLDARSADDVERELLAVGAGAAPLHAADCALLHVAPRAIALSALKPACDGDGCILRLHNPTDSPLTARVALGFPVSRVASVRLDESPDDGAFDRSDDTLSVPIAAHALRSLRLS